MKYLKQMVLALTLLVMMVGVATAQTCTPPPTCTTGQALNFVNGAFVCQSVLPAHSCLVKYTGFECPAGFTEMSISHDHKIANAWGDALRCEGPDDEDGGYSTDCVIKGSEAWTHATGMRVCCN